MPAVQLSCTKAQKVWQAGQAMRLLDPAGRIGLEDAYKLGSCYKPATPRSSSSSHQL